MTTKNLSIMNSQKLKTTKINEHLELKTHDKETDNKTPYITPESVNI